jgi:hypothetical protein
LPKKGTRAISSPGIEINTAIPEVRKRWKSKRKRKKTSFLQIT